MEKFLNLPIEKQNTIIDAALNSFGTNGYKKTSTSDIAAAAGISKGMVFHYFGSKKDLYFYLVNYCYDLVVNEMDSKFDSTVTDFFDRIMQSSKIKLSVLRKHPGALSFLTSIYFETDQEVEADIKSLLSKSYAIRDKIAFDGIDTTKFKDGIDPHLVMKMLLWMAEGFANSAKTIGFTGDNIDKLLVEYYECMNLMRNNFYKEENQQ